MPSREPYRAFLTWPGYPPDDVTDEVCSLLGAKAITDGNKDAAYLVLRHVWTYYCGPANEGGFYIA